MTCALPRAYAEGPGGAAGAGPARWARKKRRPGGREMAGAGSPPAAAARAADRQVYNFGYAAYSVAYSA